MKKIITASAALILTLTLVGCGTSASDATMNSLSAQLDKTSNTISNIQTINPSQLSINLAQSENSQDELSSNAYATQQDLLNEEYYKTDILRKTANIKNKMSKDLKLSKVQISAVKDLTSMLSKYTNSVSYSQDDMKSALKSISTLKKNVNKNYDNINAKLNKLACNSNARASYYENILNTLDQLENCLCLDSNDNITQSNPSAETQTENLSSTNSNTGLKKNIDTYAPETEDNVVEDAEDIDNDYSQSNDNYQSQRNDKRQSRYNRFRSSYNADTYGPTARNIDTYNPYRNNYYGGFNNNYGMNPYYRNRFYNEGYNPYGTNPYTNYNSNNFNRISTPNNYAFANTETEKPRLEDFEKTNEDNSVEKIAPEKDDNKKNNEQVMENQVQETSIKDLKILTDKETNDQKIESQNTLKANLRKEDLSHTKTANTHNSTNKKDHKITAY